MTQDNRSKIRIVRTSLSADYLRSYLILIDGEVAGAVGSDGLLELEVAAGSHSIEAKVDWGRSMPLTLEVLPNQTIEIEVSNNWGAWLSLWAITFGKDTYLKLTRLSPAA